MNDSRTQRRFQWKRDFALGVKDIDDDHQHLFQMAEKMHEAMIEGKGRACIEDLLSRLLDYTFLHFQHEERLMAQIGYPDFRPHQQQHARLRQRVLEMRARATSGEATMSIEVMEFLMKWLAKHTAGSDLKIEEYMRAQRIAPAGG